MSVVRPPNRSFVLHSESKTLVFKTETRQGICLNAFFSLATKRGLDQVLKSRFRPLSKYCSGPFQSACSGPFQSACSGSLQSAHSVSQFASTAEPNLALHTLE